MILRFGDKEFKADIKKLEGNISKSTEKEIEKISLNIELRGGKSKDSFLEILKNKDNKYKKCFN